MSLTVCVNENLERVRQLLFATVKDDTNFMTEPPPRVIATALND